MLKAFYWSTRTLVSPLDHPLVQAKEQNDAMTWRYFCQKHPSNSLWCINDAHGFPVLALSHDSAYSFGRTVPKAPSGKASQH